MGPSDTPLRLLVPLNPNLGVDVATLELAGKHWAFVDHDGTTSGHGPVPYACISYAWGPDRVPSPLDARHLISARTQHVFAAAVGSVPPPAVWIDSFCVPVDEPARTLTLRRLGAIYSAAEQVVVVLAATSASLLQQVQSDNRAEEDALLAFEADEWVTRAWTYQEVVNSNKLRFTVEGHDSLSVDGSDLLNCVGVAIADFKKAHGYDSALMRARHARLDALEDLIVDWKIAGYLERSAYQVMAMMASRHSERPEDYFYAMLGAISARPLDHLDSTSLSPAEYFMHACEAKGDFSFIYTSDPRCPNAGRCWRPVAGRLRVVLPWHSWGPGQTGAIHTTHVSLNGLYRQTPDPIDASAREFLQRWLGAPDEQSDGDLQRAAFERLRGWGFTGSAECLELPGGLFFPQRPRDGSCTPTALIATEVRWAHGSVGLLVQEGPDGIHHCLDVGVFVGRVPHDGEAFDVGG